jgi:hypothetical protein
VCSLASTLRLASWLLEIPPADCTSGMWLREELCTLEYNTEIEFAAVRAEEEKFESTCIFAV